jgi:pyroglutamyl-peptidase
MAEKGVFLLTGFEPFGGSDVNPSILACRELEGRTFNGYKAVVEEIPLRFHEINDIIKGHVSKYRPAAVVSTGQGGGGGLSVERVAINVGSARMPYNCGYKPVDEPLNAEGPVAYWTRLPYRGILEGLKEAGVPARLSNSAGTFGCNQIFYHLMDHLATEGIDIPAGFIHVPRLPEQALNGRSPSMSLDVSANALDVAIKALVSELKSD